MSLASMRLVVARLLTDAAYQRRFFGASPADAAQHGLTEDEFRALASLDPRKLLITSEGYGGKRLERVESAFPRTLRALEAMQRGARSRYLASTPFPPGDAEERAVFRSFVRTAGSSADAQRFLDDLADLESLLHDAPRPRLPSYRYRPEVTKPRVAPAALRLRVRGPLGKALDDPAGVPLDYPAAPAEVLVLRNGPRIVAEELVSNAAALLEACDGTRTVAELVHAFGPAAEARLQAWLRAGVVEDAAP